MCSVPGCTHKPGGGLLGGSFNTLCDSHRSRNRRHGDAFQAPVRAAHLAHYLTRLRRRQALTPDAAAWKALDERWRGLVKVCEDIAAVYATGIPMVSYEVEAAAEIVKVSNGATPRAVWQTAVAMVLLRDAEPTRFASDKAFRVQLGRRVRHLTGTSRALYLNVRLNKMTGVYRDPSPRAALRIGKLLEDAFGVAGIYLARQQQAEDDAKEAERGAFYAALAVVAPGVPL